MPEADAACRHTGDDTMIRHLAIAILAAAALGGCATDYAYRGGAGDYYYGRPSVEYYDYGYGAPYGSAYGYPGDYWRGGLSIGYGRGGYGYPYGYYGGGYPYYPPYFWYRRPHHHDNHHHRPPHSAGPIRVTGGNLRPNMVRRDAPRSPVQELSRDGGRPMRPPSAQTPWRGRAGVGDPTPMSRPMPQMVRPPSGGRVVERRASPPAIRRAPPVLPSVSREREPVSKRER